MKRTQVMPDTRRHRAQNAVAIRLLLLFSLVFTLPHISGCGETVVGGTISTDTVWSVDGSPYIVTSNITVQGTDGDDGITTLTIAPGAVVQFNQDMCLNVGASSGDPGALIAQGTSATPILFTANLTRSTAGYWNNIKIDNTASDATTVLAHCTIQYAGSGSQGALNISQAAPAIRNCTLRYNKDSAIYISGTECNSADIRANTFNTNVYGIYLADNAQPSIRLNNFEGNTSYGLYNASSILVTAENNWWGDALGPNNSGDKIYGNVDADPWMGQPSVSVVPVPDITGLALPQAELLLTQSDLTIGVLSRDYSDTVALDHVISQTPAAGASAQVGAAVNLVLSLGPLLQPSVTLTAAPMTIAQGQTTTLTWTSTNAETVAIDNGIGVLLLNGSIELTPAQTTTFTITAANPAGSATQAVTIEVRTPPTASFTIDPQNVQHGQPTTLHWQTENAESVTITPDIGSVPLSGTRAVTPGETTIYTLTATGNGLSATVTASVTVYNTGPTVNISVSPGAIIPGQPAQLIWTTSNADRCTIGQGIGNVSPSGTISVAPNISTTYTLTATGPGGSTTASTTLIIPESRPAIEASVQDRTILPGESTILTWSTHNAERCTISPAIGAVGLNGSLSLAPTVSTTYTITAYGSGVSATLDVQLTVRYPSLNITNTIAGTGSVGNSGDGGPAVMADLNAPYNMAVDRNGNLFVTDTRSYCIRKIDRNGTITTIAGTGVYGYSGDGGPATQAQIAAQEIVIDDGGNIYFSQTNPASTPSSYSEVIRKIDVNGTISTFAGVPFSVYAMAINTNNHLIVASWSSILQISPDGEQTLLAGSESSGYSGDGGPAIGARFNYITDIACDPHGNLYISDNYNHRVRKIDERGIITTVAGGGTSTEENIPAASAVLDDIYSIATDSIGNLFILHEDIDSKRYISKMDRMGYLTTVNGKAPILSIRSIGDAGAVEDVHLDNAQRIRIDQLGNWYIIEAGGNSTRIRKVGPPTAFPVLITSPADGLVSFSNEVRIAGNVQNGAQVRVNGIAAQVVDDTFYVSVPLVEGRNTILAEAMLEGSIIGYDAIHLTYLPEYYGRIEIAHGLEDVRSSAASIGYECDDDSGYRSGHKLASDTHGNLYFSYCNGIFKVAPDGIISVVAGNGNGGFSGDGGPALAAELYGPAGMVVTESGEMYFADTWNHRIRRIDANGIITTIAGTGNNAWNSIFAPALELNLAYPKDVALAPDGSLYITDTQHFRVMHMDNNGLCSYVAGEHDYLSPTCIAAVGEYMMPYGLAVDGNNRLHIADIGTQVIWRMNGTLPTPVAGTWCFDCTGTFSGDGGPATQAWLSDPRDVAIDQQGIIYIADWNNKRVRRVGIDGIIRTMVGEEGPCEAGIYDCSYEIYGGIGGPAQLAQIDSPTAIDVNAAGTVHIFAGFSIYRITSSLPATFTGRVIDADTGQPLANATIGAEWMSVAYTASTQADGGFELVDTQAVQGEIDVTVQAAGYMTYRRRFSISNGGLNEPMLIGMRRKPQLNLNLDTPTENGLYHSVQIPVAGDVSHPCRITINGVEAVDSGVEFSKQFQLSGGQNTILVSAQDPFHQSVSIQRQVTHAYMAPTAAIQASETQILRNQSTTLTWQTANAGNVRIEPELGLVAAGGSVTVSPNKTTTYTLTAENQPNIATASITIAVTQLEPVRIGCSPSLIDMTQQTTLSWACREDHADTVTITPNIGEVAPVGTMQVTPPSTNTTTYTITASGPGGTATASTTVSVNLIPPIVTLTASPMSVPYAGSSTITWSTRYADSVTLNNQGVSANGATKYINMYTSRTFTLRATGPGGTTTKSLTITVIPRPVATFSATPGTIYQGQTSSLSWNVSGADTVSINNGIGAVGFSGSVAVTPSATTQYWLTATGQGGTTNMTVSVTVNAVPAPAVVFNVSPAAIAVGGQAVLSWEVNGANSARIDHNIGVVALNGTLRIAPTMNTTYTITATGAGGTTTATATVTVDNPFAPRIDAPGAQQIIQRPDVLVRGAFVNSANLETGITVNGVTALQYGNEFMANHVPLVQGQNTITVTATDTAGHIYSQSMAVTADITGQYCTATATPEAGLSPYEGELRIAAPTELRLSNVLAYGWGNVSYGQGTPDLYPVTIDGAGLYRLAVEATAYDGHVFTDEVAVLVYDRTQLDTLLQAKWNAMKARLAAGDVPGAVSYYSNDTRTNYETIFTAMGLRLPQIAQQMGPLQMITIKDGTAKYRIKRSEIHQGQTYDITYPIYFAVGADGLWKIVRY